MIQQSDARMNVRAVITVLLRVFFPAVLCLFLLYSAIHAETMQKGDMTFGISGGYGGVAGYYSSDVKRSISGGMRFIPFVSDYFFADLSSDYTRFDLYGRYGSSILSGGLSAGPCIYRTGTYAVPFLGISGDLRYLYLSSVASQGNSATWKPGVTTQCGVFVPVSGGILFSCALKYSALSLSNRLFSSVRLDAGVSYNFGLSSRAVSAVTDEKVRESEQEFSYFADGVKAFNNRDIFSSEKYFRQLNNDSEAALYLEKIQKLKKSYALARDLRERGRQAESIPLLESLVPSMKEAERDLFLVRASLQREIPSLEKEGIAAYEQKDYKKCIVIMKRLSLVDPGNKTAKIYLPRAEKRDEAIQKLK